MDVVIVGHLGFEFVSTPHGQADSLGGAAYYSAVGAALSGARVSLVSSVGEDYPIDTIAALGIDVSHVAVQAGSSSRFVISYAPTFAERSVEFDLGVGGDIRWPDDFTTTARYIYIATNLPDSQLELLRHVRRCGIDALVAVECFDQFIQAYPETVCRVVREADLFFANLAEFGLLRGRCGDTFGDYVVKKAERGAEFCVGGRRVCADSPEVELVDPTGAGDVLAGAFLAKCSHGVEPARALDHACKMAAQVVTNFGAQALIEGKDSIARRTV
jgi:cytidine kinase